MTNRKRNPPFNRNGDQISLLIASDSRKIPVKRITTFKRGNDIFYRVMIRIEDYFLRFLGFFDINPHSYNYT